jgi:hypothetical protein
MFEPLSTMGNKYLEVKLLYQDYSGVTHSYESHNHIERLLIEEGDTTPLPLIKKIKSLAINLS